MSKFVIRMLRIHISSNDSLLVGCLRRKPTWEFMSKGSTKVPRNKPQKTTFHKTRDLSAQQLNQILLQPPSLSTQSLPSKSSTSTRPTVSKCFNHLPFPQFILPIKSHGSHPTASLQCERTNHIHISFRTTISIQQNPPILTPAINDLLLTQQIIIILSVLANRSAHLPQLPDVSRIKVARD